MPAIYAHDRFGVQVSERLDGGLRETVTRYYPQFSIGLQGPDIFFFYRPYKDNPVVRYGGRLHHLSALPFFRHAACVLRKTGTSSREYAYLIGFICHFILDSECHPYVSEMIEKTGVQHLEIEAEFEKTLLRLDGHDPFSYPIPDLLPADEVSAAAIAPFYAKSVTPELVLASLKDLRRVKQIFTAPCPAKFHVVNTLLKATGKYAYCKGLMYQRKDNPACYESNAGLLERFDSSVDLAARMIVSFDECLKTGEELDNRFDRSFE